MWLRRRFILSTAVALVAASTADAAPCCSAGASLPALITNDDFAQISLSHFYGDTVMDAPDRGVPVLRTDANEDRTQLTRLAGALKLGEFWQAGFGTSLIRRETRVSGRDYQETGLADSDLSLGYEILPEWNYSAYRPRGILYLQAVVPTGRAIQDPRRVNAADVRGQGVFQTALGISLTKTWNAFDLYGVPELRRLYGREFRPGETLGSAWGAATLIGGGYSLPGTALRLGLRTQPTYQGAREARAEGRTTDVPRKWVWNSGVDASMLFQEVWLASLAYSDQTLLGPARNTTLERSLGLLLQRRFEP